MNDQVSHEIERHPLFTPWHDPVTNVRSYVLTERVAPIQQGFYFVNPSVSDDERYLWFWCAFPPARYRTLGVVSLDPANPFIRHFPHAQFTPESPLIAASGDAIYYCDGPCIYHLSIDGTITEIARLDQQWVNNRYTDRIATHLTRSADGRYFLLDGPIGNHWFVGVAEVATGKIQILKELAAHYNHAQFSPIDPSRFLISQDWWHDRVTGQHFMFDHRTWFMDIHQSQFEPLLPSAWYGHGSAICHEWWSRDGRVCWIDYNQGAFECAMPAREIQHVWQRPLCHAHCSSDRRYWCGDQSPYTWDTQGCAILAFDRETGQERTIVSALPLPPFPRGAYHLDPHPHFSPRDTYIIYTTTVYGRIDVALTVVADMLGKAGVNAR